jgi:thioredoxin 1
MEVKKMLTLDASNFEKETNKSIPVIVDFWASWCGPCKMMGPVFEELSKEYSEDKLRFAKCSVEDLGNQVYANNFNVTGIPCLILIKDGKEVNRIVGFLQKPELKEAIDELLN